LLPISNFTDCTEKDNVGRILEDDRIIDLGGHVIAYRVPNDKNINSVYGTDENFSGDYYIAIRAISANEFYSTRDNICYLPDIYGDILEMRFEEACSLYMKYKAADSDQIEEAGIPIFFTDKIKGRFIDIKPFENHNQRRILSAQAGLQTDDPVFPQTIWQESFEFEDQTYEIIFGRVSPIFTFSSEVGGYYADYCLKVIDGEGNVISEQMIINFPVKYEEVYWNIDFSGDGFMDIAFWTDMYNVSRFGWTELATLIWNAEKNLYEKKEFPIDQDVVEKWWNMQLWNQELSSIISFVGRTEKGDAIMERYLFKEEHWNCVARLEPFYEENSNGELIYKGYQEISFPIDGNLVDKNMIQESSAVWLNKESIWSRYNMNNAQLYPCAPEWEEISMNIGEISAKKYVKAKP